MLSSMAGLRTQEPSSSSMPQPTYHAFLSFRFHDTGKAFTDHLYTSLINAGIQTFRDDDDDKETKREENLEVELGKVIERSKISLVIFSRNYASSQCCLEELVKITKCKRDFRHVIIPIFYDVSPSEVREQTGNFQEAFAKYEERSNQDSDGKRRGVCKEKLKQWRDALSQVAGLAGMVLQNRHESEFIQDIIEVVERKLNRKSLRVALYPIGLDSRIKSINLWLQDGSTDVGIMAIFGMGGIGKTTIAKTVYNINFDRFDGSSFIANIREVSEQPNGLVRLQRQLISNILNKKIKKIHNVDEGIMKIKDAISCKRVLVVLDDMDQLDQLNAVLGMRCWFYPGSKIVVTTRHERLLKAHHQCEMYQVKELDGNESLQLFSWHAFGKDHPPEGYTKLSRNVVYHCGGIPLALQVLGSSLRGRSLEVWESALKKLQEIAASDIIRKLRMSYESLLDDHDRNLFLDVACFFVGKEKDYAVTILDECDYYTIVGLQNLIDRCLLAVDKDNKLLVHQLLQDMGREIIRQESPQPGRRSRIWSHRDSYTVLRDKSGTNEIRGLILDMQMLKGKSVETLSSGNEGKKRSSEWILEKMLMMDQSYTSKRRRLDFFGNAINSCTKIPDDIDFTVDAFTMMQKLRLLKLGHVQVTGSYGEFPKGLKSLYWRGFTLKHLPCEFPLESLVALDMRYSSLIQVWKGTRSLGLLKILNLSHCHGLKKSPDFSGLPNLRRLILKDCIRLAELHESIGCLTRLVLLNLSGCRNLRRLPRQFHKLKSLERLILSGCSKLDKLPVEELGKLESLKVLHADQVAISHLASTADEVISWQSFFPSWLSKPRNFREPVNFSLASLSGSLQSLSLANCNLSDEAIPADLRGLSLLQYLNLSGNPICCLPQRIKDLYMLQDLWLDSCTSLKSLPELPMSLIDLKTVNCTSLEKITNLPNLLKSLFLDVSGCQKLAEVQGMFRLEPIRNFNSDMIIKDLGLLNLDILENDQVELYNKLTKTRQKDVVQGLLEFGIFSTYIPGGEIPAWCSWKTTETSVSFIVCSEESDAPKVIQGLKICVIYGRSNAKKSRYWINQDWCTYYIRIDNKTKGLKWVYSPTFVGIPDEEQDMTLLSHWKFGNEMEVGADMTVSVVCWSYAFQMKGIGVGLMNVQEEKVEKSKLEEGSVSQHTITEDPSNVCKVDGALSAYQLQPHAYLLSNAEYIMLRKPADGVERWTRTSLYEGLFEGSAENTGSRNEGQEEDDDSGYDYPENSDEEIGEYDDDDFEWLNAIL